MHVLEAIVQSDLNLARRRSIRWPFATYICDGVLDGIVIVPGKPPRTAHHEELVGFLDWEPVMKGDQDDTK